MTVDLFTPLAVVLFFTMAATLRFSVGGNPAPANSVLRLATHRAWLFPFIVTGGLTLGAFYLGKISPWPVATFDIVAAKYGYWAGVAAVEAAITADVWLLWGGAAAFKAFTPPEEAGMIKYYYIVNLAIGGYLIARFLHVLDMGDIGILPDSALK